MGTFKGLRFGKTMFLQGRGHLLLIVHLEEQIEFPDLNPLGKAEKPEGEIATVLLSRFTQLDY